MRTLSARILLGFAALAVAFGAITVNVVLNLSRVEESIHSIRVGYLPLALAANTLARREEDLKSYLDDGLPQETSSYGANVRLRTARGPRDAAFKGLTHAVEDYKHLDVPVISIRRRPLFSWVEPLLSAMWPRYPDGGPTIAVEPALALSWAAASPLFTESDRYL